MSDLRKAAEMALKFIDETNVSSSFRLIPGSKLNETISALRQALAHHNDYLKNALEEEWRNGYRVGKQDALLEKPVKSYCGGNPNYCTEPEEWVKQKPVAWLDEETNVIYRLNTHEVDQLHGFKPTTPLYRAPPKREWVGLTHEERFLNDCRSPEEIEYAIAIEAKLKEKNNG